MLFSGPPSRARGVNQGDLWCPYKTPRFGIVLMVHKRMTLPLSADHTGRSDNITDLCTTGAY
jgi:hypothetical protein